MKVFFFKPVISGPDAKKYNVRGLAIVSHDTPAQAAQYLMELPSKSSKGHVHWQYSHAMSELVAPAPKLHAMHVQFAIK